MKKNIALLLALLMMGSQLAACSESTDNTDTSAGTTAPSADAVESETTDPNAKEELGIEDTSYGGHTFNIFQHFVWNGPQLDFFAEEVTGEPINDADLDRMTVVEDKLDIDIVPITQEVDNRGANQTLQISVQAGTNDYDIASLSAYSACNSLVAGLLTNLHTVTNLDLSRSWWDQYCNEECTFGDALYFMTGDISTNDNLSTYAIYFNKNMAADYALPNFYDDVDNMKWTTENLKTYASVVTANLDYNQNGKHVNDIEDIYGIWIWDDIMMGIVNAAGVKCCTVNDKGELTFTLNTEKFINTFEQFSDYAFNQDLTCAYQRSGYEQPWGQIAFRESRGLFYLSSLSDATGLRDMEDDFGILPMPLYDEAQTRYYNSVASWPMSFYTIPRNTYGEEEYARTGHILQMLGYESKYSLTPAYYEQTLQNKVSRDEESAAMLDLIFATRTYDFGWYFEIGKYNESIMNLLRNYNTNVSSMLQANAKSVTRALEKYNDTILSLEEE